MTPPSTSRLIRTAVPAHPSHAAGVRRLVATHLRLWRLSELLDSAVLATGELFANAIRHAGAHSGDTIAITLECDDQELRITIADPSPVVPRPRVPDAAEESGRGLSIVAALVDDWGTAPPDTGKPGKKVWFSLATKGAA